MKKILSAVAGIVLLCYSIPSFAQIKKGEITVGGTISIVSEKIDYEDYADANAKAFGATITPQIGFGLGNNWVVGVGVGYAFAKVDYGGIVNDQKTNTYTGGVFVRRFYAFQEKFGIYGQFDAAAGFGKGERGEDDYYDTKITVLSGQLQPGFYFRPSKKLILEASFGKVAYTSTKTDYSAGHPDTKDNKLEFSITEGLAFGFKIVL